MTSERQEQRRWLRLDQILVPLDCLRPVSDKAVEALAAMIKEQGQLSPIAVYMSSAAERPYTLIYGARRLRAMELLGEERIEVVLRRKEDARMLEVAENLFQSELTQLDRAYFTKEWFNLKGIKRGRPKKGNSDILSELFPERMLSEDAAKHLGFVGRTARRLCSIAENLSPELRDLFQGTEIANKQSALLKFAKMEPLKQRQAAIAFRETGDVKMTLKVIEPTKGRMDEQTRLLGNFIESWSRMNEATKQKALEHAGLTRAPMPRDSLTELARNSPGHALPDIYSTLAEREAVPRTNREFDKRYQDYLVQEQRAIIRAEERMRELAEASKKASQKEPQKRRKKTANGKFMGRPRKTFAIRLHEWFIPQLAEQLLRHKVDEKAPLLKLCRELTEEKQDVLAAWLAYPSGFDLYEAHEWVIKVLSEGEPPEMQPDYFEGEQDEARTLN
ncbi:ParB N-terminal domain-containing protein [Brucella sp. 6810]|uniref:ParB/RepB/Spo0J family partition protein n=1 Tax=Brucella sp. 6810 TaxID=2769351 RepID=UPI00165B263D|nr:ParB N-terminal domain-containing protein [Brucella sp. 6810]QNQ63074.1 ParB N-terminal domain-containing protein [Brucella sp. 6810]